MTYTIDDVEYDFTGHFCKIPFCPAQSGGKCLEGASEEEMAKHRDSLPDLPVIFSHNADGTSATRIPNF